jgi:PKD repeat protein
LIDEGTSITLNGSGSTDNVGIVRYIWTFDNGHEIIILQGVSPTYNFTVPGIYSVTLNVTDAAGNSDTDALTITVNDITAPTANAGPDQSIDEGAIVFFNGSGSTDNMGIENYTWTLNDGIENIILHGIFPSHAFTVSGVYTARLNVTDASGLWNADTMLVTVNPDAIPPIAEAGPDQSVNKNDTVSFNGTGSFDNAIISNYTWNFTCNGSAYYLYGAQPSFRFWAAGNYTIMLTVHDAAGNTGTDTVNVSVAEKGTDPGGEEPDDEDSDQVVGAGVSMELTIAIIVAVIIGILAVFLFTRWNKSTNNNLRGKSPPPSRPPPEP